MKKVILLLVSIFLVSCGSVEKLKEKKETKIDSTSQTNSGSDFSKFINSDKYSLAPADLSQPMIFKNSKGEVHEYFNTVIKHEKEIVHEQKKDTLANKTELKKEDSEDKKFKETDNTMVILGCFGLFLAFLFGLILYFINSFNKKFALISKTLEKLS